jgi:hypothetical protein
LHFSIETSSFAGLPAPISECRNGDRTMSHFSAATDILIKQQRIAEIMGRIQGLLRQD